MLDLKKNRLNYGELLAPPSGYDLAYAVGTTYSLDLFALLAVPVALFYAKSMEGDFSQSRFDVLESIRQSKEKVTVFCQRGKIKVPPKYNPLLAFVEDCIVEVEPDKFNASFHPKLWVLRFESEDDQCIYRVITLSRNLTFDRSWDVAVHTQGVLKNTINPNSKKLANYLAYFLETEDREVPSNFLEDLKKVDFECPEFFDELSFYPILGFQNNISNFKNPLQELKFKNLLIISPFVDITTLKHFKNTANQVTLISRQEELQLLPEELLNNFEVWCLNPLVVQGEDMIDSEDEIPLRQNLHAKIFIGDTLHNTTTYVMGSANCTNPAFTRNAEFVVGLETPSKNLRVRNIKEQLLNDDQDIFQRFYYKETLIDEESLILEKLLRKVIFKLGQITFKGSVKQSENSNNYELLVKAIVPKLDNDNITLSLALIHKNENTAIDLNKGVINEIVFENIAITNISKFLVLRIYHKKILVGKLVLKMELEIPEERDATIFNTLINNRNKFFQYLQFLLAPEEFKGILEIDKVETLLNHSASNGFTSLSFQAPIYENLLIAASRSPQKLLQIDKVISYLQKQDENIVSEFLPMWQVFKEFINEK